MWLVEDTGRGSNDFKAEIGDAVQVTGDIYYVPIYIDVDGEFIGTTPVTIAILPKSINVLKF